MKINGTVFIPVDEQEYLKKMSEKVERIQGEQPPASEAEMQKNILTNKKIMDRIKMHFNINVGRYISLGIFNDEYGIIVFNDLTDAIHRELKRYNITRCESNCIGRLSK